MHKENFRLQLMRNQLVYERRYNKQMQGMLVDQEKEALRNLEAHASSFDARGTITKAGQKLFDDAAADALFEKNLLPTLINLGEEQGALALIFAGDEDTEFRMTAPYEKLLRSSTAKMSRNFNDDTLDRLNKTLAEGIQAGEALDKLRKRIEDVYDFKSRVSSMRVARTETLKASNNATNEAYRQTGYVKEKQWLTNPGACPECDAFNGKTVSLEEVFIKQGQDYTFTNDDGEEQSKTVTYEDVENPPLHPNCRCTIIPVR